MGLRTNRWACISLSFLCAGSLSSCQLGYMLRQGLGQLEVSWGSRPLEEVLQDHRISEEQKTKIRFIDELAAFGERELGLVRNQNYTRFYDTQGKAVSYNIFACPKTTLAPLLWTFPIVGAIPYLGFFDLELAKAQKKELEEQGFDVHLGTVWAYSTLGWFEDPIFSSMLADDEIALSRLILHEMTHATIYRPGEAEFNESLAEFVGDRGAALFLQKKYGFECRELEELKRRLHDEAELDSWLSAFVTELETLYASSSEESEKLAQREELFSQNQARLSLLAQSGNRAARSMEKAKWNNALLLALKTYRTDVHLFELFYRKQFANLRLCLLRFREIPANVNALEFLRNQQEEIPKKGR